MGQRPLTRAEATFTTAGETYRLATLHGDEIGVLAPMLCEVFGSARFTPEWLRRKYAWECTGVGGFACAAFSADGTPAAAIGALPWPVRFGEHRELAIQLGESSTAPAHRGRGLYVRLVELAHEVCDQAGVALVLIFPNRQSFPIMTSKLGYRHVGDLAEFQPSVRTLWVERIARRAGIGGSYERAVGRLTRHLAEAHPDPLSSVLDEGYAGVERDEEFLAYKARFGRSRVLRLDGARGWVTARHGLLVGDLAASSDDALSGGLDALGGVARRLGAHRLLFQVSPDLRLARLLRTRTPETGARPVVHFDLRSRIPPEALRFTLGDINTF
jgi:hypothetical protein